ncbi:hypothetical protein [Streptomyces sp. enrichment culture]|uniref:hypothetical protein n=1 Tax=Streptomyces sp. enrichment culture TaxID=1795815 RepID=UPI003F575315
MAHRPYPVAARALRQIMRRHRNEIPAVRLPSAQEAVERLQAGFAASPSSGDYVLSARRR